VGKREEFTEAPVEEDVMCGKDALHLGYVVVFYTPIRRDLFGASDIEECFRAGLCVVVHSDMGGMIAAIRKAWCWRVEESWRCVGETLMRYGIRRRARRSDGLWVSPK